VPKPSRVAFSPLVRTTQTAEAVAAALGLDPVTCPALAPGTDVRSPERFIDDGVKHQIIVSHQPFVSEQIRYWLDPAQLEPLMPGGYACIELITPAEGAGRLVFAEPSIY
jgi:phosphohistidine phosphatase SixA